MSEPRYPKCPECRGHVRERWGVPTCSTCGVEASQWNARTGTVGRWVTRQVAADGRRALREMVCRADGDLWTRWGDEY